MVRLRWVVIGLLGAAAAFGTWAVMARFVLHGPVDAASLAVSVGRASGSAGELLGDVGSCRRARRPAEWRCVVTDSEGSGGATYAVRVRDGSSCWDGRLVRDDSEGGMPREASRCVHLWQWSFVSLL